MRYSIMTGYCVREPPKSVPDTLVSEGFIQPHQRGRAGHIGMQDYGEFPRGRLGHRVTLSLGLSG